jgi:hypothetical protein
MLKIMFDFRQQMKAFSQFILLKNRKQENALIFLL